MSGDERERERERERDLAGSSDCHRTLVVFSAARECPQTTWRENERIMKRQIWRERERERERESDVAGEAAIRREVLAVDDDFKDSIQIWDLLFIGERESINPFGEREMNGLSEII